MGTTIDSSWENSQLVEENARLRQSEREGWRHADELEQERKRLSVRVDRLQNQVSVAKTIVAAGVDLMHHTQLGKWAGVRSFLEQDTDDYEPFETPNAEFRPLDAASSRPVAPATQG